MYTLFDYLKFYKNKPIGNEINDIDLLFLSLLTYLPIDSYNGKMNFDEFINYSLNFKTKSKNRRIVSKVYELLDIIKNSKRYSKVRIFNPVNIKDENTQFGAMTFRIGNNTVISYKGTDGSYIGWIENFRLSYKFPTYTQVLALKYLKDNTTFFDKNIYLTGHSKGGNLALYSLYESNNSLYNKINKVLNFDGPGFRHDEFISEKYNDRSSKIVNYIPTGSIVGVLMENDKYNVVKSNEIAWMEHDPTTWELFGEFFIEGELSSASKKIHNVSTINTRKLDYKKVENAFEKLYPTLGKKYDSDFRLNHNDFMNFYKNMKNIDPEIAEYLKTIFNSVLQFNKENKKKIDN